MDRACGYAHGKCPVGWENGETRVDKEKYRRNQGFDQSSEKIGTMALGFHRNGNPIQNLPCRCERKALGVQDREWAAYSAHVER